MNWSHVCVPCFHPKTPGWAPAIPPVTLNRISGMNEMDEGMNEDVFFVTMQSFGGTDVLSPWILFVIFLFFFKGFFRGFFSYIFLLPSLY